MHFSLDESRLWTISAKNSRLFSIAFPNLYKWVCELLTLLTQIGNCPSNALEHLTVQIASGSNTHKTVMITLAGRISAQSPELCFTPTHFLSVYLTVSKLD